MSRAREAFQVWTAENIHNVPGVWDREAMDAEMKRLRAQLERDLPVLLAEIEEELGELDDLLLEAYENVYDPETGFQDGSDA